MPQDEENKIFDISKPDQTVPSSSSKPVIVGHHPMMNDPMIKESDNTPKPDHQAMEVVGGSTSGGLAPISDPIHSEPETKPTSLEHPVEHPADTPSEPGLIKPLPAGEPPNYAPDTGFTPVEKLVGSGDSDAEHHGSHPKYDMSHLVGNSPLHSPPNAGPHRGWRRPMVWALFGILALLVAGYLAVDSGAIGGSINLPFHIFKQKAKTSSSTTPPPASQAVSPTPVPDGFKEYKLADAALLVDFPTTWGTPTYGTDQGYSKRGGSNKTDGTYAYIIDFSTNKDVEVAVTSSKYLPPARTFLYFDFLQWCMGTNDNQYYLSALHFITANGVDTPGTISCDQGPLVGVSKLDSTTIVQLKAKTADNKILGDLYTKNLDSVTTPVIRIKDTTMTHAAEIKQVLGTVRVPAASPVGQ